MWSQTPTFQKIFWGSMPTEPWPLSSQLDVFHIFSPHKTSSPPKLHLALYMFRKSWEFPQSRDCAAHFQNPEIVQYICTSFDLTMDLKSGVSLAGTWWHACVLQNHMRSGTCSPNRNIDFMIFVCELYLWLCSVYARCWTICILYISVIWAWWHIFCH